MIAYSEPQNFERYVKKILIMKDPFKKRIIFPRIVDIAKAVDDGVIDEDDIIEIKVDGKVSDFFEY